MKQQFSLGYKCVVLCSLMGCYLTAGAKTPVNEFSGKKGEVKLLLLDPGHFHADLLQKSSNERISDSVYVYAPAGTELTQHMQRIATYNQRQDHPTAWKESVYTEDDFFSKMLSEKKGNVVVLAGNNRKKSDYIRQSVQAGYHVLADKPMAINKDQFEQLKESFAIAKKNDVLLYDMMTERYDILNIVEKELMGNKELFGVLERGTTANPAVYVESVHHFYKNVSGNALIRPAWYYDVEQQGEGIVDVTTHLIDIVNWQCFPNVALDYTKDLSLQSATHWTTDLTLQQFSLSTRLNRFPEYLTNYVYGDFLKVYANGEIHYRVKGVNIALKVVWNFEAPAGSGDTYSSVITGSRASCLILQQKEQAFVPQLYIQKAANVNQKTFEKALGKAIKRLQQTYPFISVVKEDDKIRIEIPVEKREGHEAHFARVAEKYFDFLAHRNMPAWEVPNMLAKYYITTEALKMADSTR